MSISISVRLLYVRTDEGFLVLRIAHRREVYRK